jgi:hypothetical protein
MHPMAACSRQGACECTAGILPPDSKIAGCPAINMPSLCCAESGYPAEGSCTCALAACVAMSQSSCECGLLDRDGRLNGMVATDSKTTACRDRSPRPPRVTL